MRAAQPACNLPREQRRPACGRRACAMRDRRYPGFACTDALRMRRVTLFPEWRRGLAARRVLSWTLHFLAAALCHVATPDRILVHARLRARVRRVRDPDA